MPYTYHYDDAQKPTPLQVKRGAIEARKAKIWNWADIGITMFGLILFPIGMGWLMGYALLTSPHNDWPLIVAIIVGVLTTALCFVGFISVASAMQGGRVIMPQMLAMFHESERPIKKEQWAEVEILLNLYPATIPQAAEWVARHEGALLHRHLWSLRRMHVPSHYPLGVVETMDAFDACGGDLVVEYHESQRQPPPGPADILDGKLMVYLNARALDEQCPPSSATIARPRL